MNSYYWFLKGGTMNVGNEAGIFNTSYMSGSDNSILSFRLILTPSI